MNKKWMWSPAAALMIIGCAAGSAHAFGAVFQRHELPHSPSLRDVPCEMTRYDVTGWHQPKWGFHPRFRPSYAQQLIRERQRIDRKLRRHYGVHPHAYRPARYFGHHHRYHSRYPVIDVDVRF